MLEVKLEADELYDNYCIVSFFCFWKGDDILDIFFAKLALI